MTSKEKARLAGLELEVYQLHYDIDEIERKLDEVLARPVRLPCRVHMTPSLTWIGYTRTNSISNLRLGHYHEKEFGE